MNIEEARKQLTSCADTGDTPSAWARDAAEFCKRKGIFNGDGAGQLWVAAAHYARSRRADSLQRF